MNLSSEDKQLLAELCGQNNERWGRTTVNVCYIRIYAKNNPDIWA
jgi:hypothetical protein